MEPEIKTKYECKSTLTKKPPPHFLHHWLTVHFTLKSAIFIKSQNTNKLMTEKLENVNHKTHTTTMSFDTVPSITCLF